MKKEKGLRLWIDLLRPLDWVELNGVGLGKSIFLDLPEMGAVGWAEVTSLGPCPKINGGKGSVVTGRFVHESDGTDVVRLTLEGETGATTLTANHLYWSVVRQDFVPAGNLLAGEEVDTFHGTSRVLSVTPIDFKGLLHNLESHQQHVFRVGSLGTLVHNFCLHRIYNDARGRVHAAVAHITQKDLRTGTATNAATRAASRALGTGDAGHLISRLLGGPGGAGARNFFPQLPKTNRGKFAQFEKDVARLVDAGNDVWIRVSLRYKGNSTRPYEVLYQVRVNGSTVLTRTFSN
jgi:hypothetical protein